MPYVIVADEAFPLKPYLMRPYSTVILGGNEVNKIFNYRLSRARRVVENAFEILSNRWRVLKTNIQVQPKSVDNMVLAACCLHNMLCQSHDFQLDETNNYESTEVLENMEPLRGNSTQRSFEIREIYKDFFLSSVGAENSLHLLPSLMEKRKSQIAVNRELVKQVIDAILYLGRHSLALRDHREKFSDSLRGNYKDLILLSSHSPIIASYLTQVQTNGKSILSFISWERQNQMIDAISSHIAKKITTAISKSVVFSISLDTSFDISRKDQLSFVVRYVTETTGCVQKRFLALKSTYSTTGESLMSVFEEICQTNNLLWKENLIGQSYDGASNMRG
ncbi:hypothetical protein QTP88_019256 [Uroleucon formosanum]